MTTTIHPTSTQFNAYSKAFDHFNASLFGGQLPDCLLNFSRKARANGFFAPSRWSDREGTSAAHEISLNPDLLLRPAEAIMGTLVHEMVHLWQEQFGRPSRTTYHNREWAAKMEEIGLMPSDTGESGGRRTGQRMTHYIIPDGAYAKAFAGMPPESLLPWVSAAGQRRARMTRRDKVAYQCPSCLAKVWGKGGLLIACGDCKSAFVEGV